MTNNTENYSVGDVVYILSDKKQAIIPALVIEETVIHTLDGKKISWKFAAGPEGKKRIFNSAEMKSEIFSSLDDLENLLQQRFSKLIKDTINQARKYENAWYGQTIKKQNPQNKKEEEKIPVKSISNDPTDSLLEDLGGEPTEEAFQEKLQNISQTEQQEDIRAKLRQQIGPTEEELKNNVEFEQNDFTIDEQEKNDKSQPNSTLKMITMPDGNKIPVNMGV